MNRKIKAMLVERGIKQCEIAADLGLTRGTVSNVIRGYARSRRVEKYVADLLGVEYDQLWVIPSGSGHKKAA